MGFSQFVEQVVGRTPKGEARQFYRLHIANATLALAIIAIAVHFCLTDRYDIGKFLGGEQ
jgi:hypothetical protein